MRHLLLSSTALLAMGILLSGCVEKVGTGQASAEGGAQVAQSPGPSDVPLDPKANNGRIVPDAESTPASPASDAGSGYNAPPVPTTTGQTIPPADKGALEQKVKAAEAALAKNPNDPNLKKQLAQALYEQGQVIMHDPNLMPREKYAPALKLFNRALALDPAQSGAKESRDLIVQIYQSMGRPVPQ